MMKYMKIKWVIMEESLESYFCHPSWQESVSAKELTFGCHPLSKTYIKVLLTHST